MDKENKQAIFNGKTYYLNSDNKDLLQLLKDARYNKETKKMESVPYLPIETIYQLLEQFYPNYSLESRPLEIEKIYTIEKEKYNYTTKQREKKQEEVVLFKKSVKLIIGDRFIEGSARGVASIGMITIDQLYNGFDCKQEGRALKNSCKKLGSIFRIPGDREEIMEVQSIKDDLSITDVVKEIQGKTNEDVNKEAVDNITNEIENIIRKDYEELVASHEGELKITDLQEMGIKLREKHNFKKGDDTDTIMRKIYAELKEKHIK